MYEKDFMKYLRTTIPFSDMKTLLSHTNCIRQIRCFPKRANQHSIAYLIIEKYSNILRIYTKDSLGICFNTLRKTLPKRISLIRDWTYISEKDYNRHLKDFS